MGKGPPFEDNMGPMVLFMLQSSVEMTLSLHVFFSFSYYCYECHTDDEHMIPSKVVHNWDLSKYKGTANSVFQI
jgi:hypothetical protein